MNVSRWVVLCVMKHVMVMIVTVPVSVVTDIWYHSLPGYQGRESVLWQTTTQTHHSQSVSSPGRTNSFARLLQHQHCIVRDPLSSPQFPSVPRLFPATTPNDIDLCPCPLSLSHFDSKWNIQFCLIFHRNSPDCWWLWEPEMGDAMLETTDKVTPLRQYWLGWHLLN